MSIRVYDQMARAFLACVWAVQAVVLSSMVLSAIHVPGWLESKILPEVAGRIAAKWDLLLYAIFIAVAFISHQVLSRNQLARLNRWHIIFEASVAFLMVSAEFKMLVNFKSPQLAHTALMVLTAIAVMGKIFYPELKAMVVNIYRWETGIHWTPYADFWWVGIIVLLVFMPRLEHVVGLMYIGDWLEHFDYAVMSVGWASLWGQIPYADVISQYGVGLPIIFAKLIQNLGGFEYVPALRVIMWFVILYFILTYFFTRMWLGSAAIAGICFLLFFRLQMFHYGVSPLVWITPSALPLRFGLDIVWLAMLLMHVRTGKNGWLIAAAIYSGFSVYYMSSSGFCVMAAFYFYLLALQLIKKPASWLCWVLPFLTAGLFFAITLKGHLLQQSYWHNFFDYMSVFGHTGAMPMFESLKYRHFWAFFMSMAMLFTYLATLLYIGVGVYLKQMSPERLICATICVYGLANYYYYVVRSAVTSYYVNALPFVLVVCFWFTVVLKQLPQIWQKRLMAIALLLSVYALWTNQNYLAYPNTLNVSANPLTDPLVIQRFPDQGGFFNNRYRNVLEKDKGPLNNMGQAQEDFRTEDDFKSDEELAAFYRQSVDFSKDAALIDRLTKPGERVALLSSFETKILIQANRPPFFYHFPSTGSRPMSFRSIPTDAAHTPAYVADALNAFNRQKPNFVFMEKVYAQDIESSAPRMAEVLAYVKHVYYPFEQGQYLVAMKRKEIQ